MTVAAEVTSAEVTETVLTVSWPKALNGPDQAPLREAITLLLDHPGGRIEGDDAVELVLNAGGRDVSWLRRPSVRLWIEHNDLGTPRVWLTKQARRDVRVHKRTVAVTPVAPVRLVAAKPLARTPEPRPRTKVASRVKTRTGSTLLLIWPETLCGPRFAKERRILAYLFANGGVRGVGPFAAFSAATSLQADPQQAMRWLARMAESGWITRSALGTPEVRLGERSHAEIKMRVESPSPPVQAPKPARTIIPASLLPVPTGYDPTWPKRAACIGADLEDFAQETGPAAERARQLCRTCTERLHCLVTALERPEEGIRGGMNKARRQAARRRRTTNYPWRFRYEEVRALCEAEDQRAAY
jgi:Transcription factor WhiB